MARKLQGFPWYGAKIKHFSDMEPYFPKCKRFVDVFGGSGAVILNYPHAELRVFNDIDRNVVHFFRTLKEQKGDFVEYLDKYFPYHEGLFYEAQEKLENPEDLDSWDKAAYFFVSTAMAYNAGSKSFAYSTKQIRRGKSQHVSRYEYKINQLDKVAQELTDIQFMCRDFRKIIKRFEKDDTLLYLDPPYPASVRSGVGSYNHEMAEEDHLDMLSLLNDYPEKAMLSSYENELYDKNLEGFEKVYLEEKGTGATNSGGTRTEVLYCNYDIGGEDIGISNLERNVKTNVSNDTKEDNLNKIADITGVDYKGKVNKKFLQDLAKALPEDITQG